MTGNQIYDLLELLPAGIELYDTPRPPAVPRTCRDFEQRAVYYAEAYADLQFGWRFTRAIFENGHTLTPQMCQVCGEAVKEAFRYLSHNSEDPHIFEVMMIANSPHHATHRRTLTALLTAKDFNLSTAALHTGLSPKTIDYYEKLFYNILDRRSDSLLLATVLYPNTRMVEMFDGYLRDPESRLSLLLQRAGYNQGVQDVLYLSGLPAGQSLLHNLEAQAASQKLEALIMANGYMLARNGWINQRNGGVAQAKGLLAAAKAGGNAGDPTQASPFATLSGTFQQEMVTLKQAEAGAAIKRGQIALEAEKV